MAVISAYGSGTMRGVSSTTSSMCFFVTTVERPNQPPEMPTFLR